MGVHRWDLRVYAVGRGQSDRTPILTYGSTIGGRDRQQRVEPPIQIQDCRLEFQSRHAFAHGWRDDQGAVIDDTPSLLVIGFCNPAAPMAQRDDVLVSFAFTDARPTA